MTLKINFSHHYAKMPYGFQESKLLDVLPVRLEDLSPGISEVRYLIPRWRRRKQYQLPKSGNYMILLLQASSGAGPLWTTIRSQWPPEKLEYYRSHIGEVFECRITE